MINFDLIMIDFVGHIKQLDNTIHNYLKWKMITLENIEQLFLCLVSYLSSIYIKILNKKRYFSLLHCIDLSTIQIIWVWFVCRCHLILQNCSVRSPKIRNAYTFHPISTFYITWILSAILWIIKKRIFCPSPQSLFFSNFSWVVKSSSTQLTSSLCRP